MRIKHYFLTILMLACTHAFCATPTGLTVDHKNGQTFLTWKDVSGATAYRIYRSTSVLNAGALTAANRVAEINSGSSDFGFWQIVGPDDRSLPAALGTKYYRIEDLGPTLTEGDELFVWTTQETGGGTFYYAVTAVSGSEDATVASGNSTGPVNEEECTMIVPVQQKQTSDQSGHLFWMWMPYDKWATYFQGYGYPAYLAADPKFIGQTTKLRLLMHGAGAFFSKSLSSSDIKTAEEAYSKDFLTLVGDDPSMTWHFGFADQPKAGDDNGSRPSNTIVKNYTQYRYWCMIRWLMRGDAPWKADSNEIFLEGHSMGGTGAMEFAIHHPELFAYISSSSEGINNWKMGPGYEGDGWVKNFEKYIGLETQNFPYRELVDKNKLIVNADNGFSTWGWLSMRDSVTPTLRNRDDLPYLNFNHGTQDGSIDWEPQGAPVWYDNNLNPFAANLIPYTGGWMDKGHSNSLGRAVSGRSKLPRTHFVLAFKNSESDDKLSSACIGVATCNDKGQFNLRIAWSTERDVVETPPVDSPSLFETTLKLDTGYAGSTMPAYSGPSNPTVDITPRRLQNFPRIPNADYDWENIPVGGGSAIQSGTVTADAYGIFTIPGFRFTVAGNKLRVTTDAMPVRATPVDAAKSGFEISASPNPFRSNATISVSRMSHIVYRKISFQIFNIKGQIVHRHNQRNTKYDIRNTSFTWDASNHPAGIYIVKARMGDMTRSIKIMLVE